MWFLYVLAFMFIGAAYACICDGAKPPDDQPKEHHEFYEKFKEQEKDE